MLLHANKRILTLIPGLGRAHWRWSKGRLSEAHLLGEADRVSGRNVRDYDLIAGSVPGAPFLHLDIRTPFGESVPEPSIESAFQEALGRRSQEYRRLGWHLYFAEDTNLGSNHRIFLSLERAGGQEPPPEHVDKLLPLENAVEALADRIASERGSLNFQFLLGLESWIYSCLFVEGQPFHLIRLDRDRYATGEAQQWDWPAVLRRLEQHRAYAAAGRNGGQEMEKWVATGDPLLRRPEFSAMAVRTWDSGLENLPGAPDASTGFIGHMGLALAAQGRSYDGHNRMDRSRILLNRALRERHLAFRAFVAAALVGLLLAAGGGWRLWKARRELSALSAGARSHAQDVEALAQLRAERARLEADLLAIRPVWQKPVAWDGALGAIAAALPENGGLEGLSATRDEEGMVLTFKVWVRDWDAVGAFRDRLAGSGRLESVSLSDQKRDPRSGIVAFYVNCRVKRI